MKEIYARGPIACNVDANYILNYTTGIVTAKSGPCKLVGKVFSD